MKLKLLSKLSLSILLFTLSSSCTQDYELNNSRFAILDLNITETKEDCIYVKRRMTGKYHIYEDSEVGNEEQAKDTLFDVLSRATYIFTMGGPGWGFDNNVQSNFADGSYIAVGDALENRKIYDTFDIVNLDEENKDEYKNGYFMSFFYSLNPLPFTIIDGEKYLTEDMSIYISYIRFENENDYKSIYNLIY